MSNFLLDLLPLHLRQMQSMVCFLYHGDDENDDDGGVHRFLLLWWLQEHGQLQTRPKFEHHINSLK